MIRLFNWFSGWRRDLDGWLVRAKRASDPCDLPVDVGFVEESAVAVRTHDQARSLDLQAEQGAK